MFSSWTIRVVVLECVLVHSESFFGQAIKSPPHKAINEHHNKNHRQCCGKKHRVISNGGRSCYRRSNSDDRSRSSAKIGVFRPNARIPCAAAGGGLFRYYIRKTTVEEYY